MLFIDNIFRFTQAGSEVSALLGRMPSAVGYQPTLATEMGALQERITSTKNGSITSVQAVYVPADDLTDPAPATAFSFLWMPLRCSAVRLRSWAFILAVDPLGFDFPCIRDPLIIGEEHYQVRQKHVQSNCCRDYKELQDIIAILGVGRAGCEEDKIGRCPCTAVRSGSCRSRSMLPNSLPVWKASTFLWKKLLPISRHFVRVNMTICPNRRSCW